MKPRSSLLTRFFALFRRRRVVRPEPIHPTPGSREGRPPLESRVRGIEPLEGRIAPASFTANSISFNDLDGDQVTITFSKNLFDPADTIDNNHLNQIFKFTNGTTASTFGDTGPQQLQLIDLTQTDTDIKTFLKAADGVSFTVTATTPTGGMGDGLTKVGEIEATGIALGRVEIDGDLGQIDCGRGVMKVGLQALIVNSLFKYGNTTQVSGGTATEQLESLIKGELTTLDVKTDVYGYLHVVSSSGIVGSSIKTVPGRIGSITVGGSLIGNNLVATTSDNTGSIQAQAGIGTVQILGINDPNNANDVAGLVGGGGKYAGSIVAGTTIGTVKIADSLNGGGGTSSGSIVALAATAPSITVGGSIVGGAGVNSGSIQALALTKATIAGNVTGAGGENSGTIDITKTIGSLTINGDVTGSTGINSGGISSGGLATLINIVGDLTGGGGYHSGAIDSLTSLGTIKIGGEITGGAGDRSGTIIADGKISSIIATKLVGGTGENSGSIFAAMDPALKGTLTSVTLTDGILGNTGISSGSIIAGKIGTVKLGSATHLASLTGGQGDFSGMVYSSSTITTVSVFGSVTGADGDESGSIQSHGNLTTVNITGNLAGGAGDFSGMIRAQEIINDEFVGTAANLGTVTIGGDIVGGTGLKSGRVEASGSLTKLTAGALQAAGTEGAVTNGSGAIVVGSGFLGAGNASSIALRGAVTSEANATTDNAGAPEIFVDGRLSSLKINGGLIDARVSVGRDLVSAIIGTGITRSTITAVGQAAPVAAAGDVAIKSLTVNGDVTDSKILAGYAVAVGSSVASAPTAVNADASIGTVKVTGNWTASSLIAGVQDTDGDGFGDADDVKIAGGTDRTNMRSQIASVTITGTVNGSNSNQNDHFGFEAQRILAFKSGGVALKFTGATDAPTELGTTSDITVREVPL